MLNGYLSITLIPNTTTDLYNPVFCCWSAQRKIKKKKTIEFMLNMASGGGCITFKQSLFILTGFLESLNIISGNDEKKGWTFCIHDTTTYLVQHGMDKSE